MKPISFKQQTMVIAEDQPEYLPLPAWRADMDATGTVIFCWQLSWKDVLNVILTRKIWHRVLTFNKPLQPQLLETECPFEEAK